MSNGNDKWLEQMTKKMGKPPSFVRRRSLKWLNEAEVDPHAWANVAVPALAKARGIAGYAEWHVDFRVHEIISAVWDIVRPEKAEVRDAVEAMALARPKATVTFI